MRVCVGYNNVSVPTFLQYFCLISKRRHTHTNTEQKAVIGQQLKLRLSDFKESITRSWAGVGCVACALRLIKNPKKLGN